MYRSEIQELEMSLAKRENLPLIRKYAQEFYKTHSLEDCWQFACESWKSTYFQIQEISVFLCGYIAHQSAAATLFLKDTVSQHPDWRVQEVLAMAFDAYCKSIGYENSLQIINEWISSDNHNNRRAVTEGLRVWTSRPFFSENPQIAISILSSLKEDNSLYVRKSVGNALRDISKKHRELIEQELFSWDLSNKKIQQVYKLAHKYLDKLGG